MKYAFLFIVLCYGGVAAADDARAAFERGQAAFKAGRIHEACDAFAASEKLAPSVETETKLADCYERDGKPVSAARLYRKLADADTSVDRRKAASAKATKLEARAPKLRFAINPLPAGIVVKVDGEVVTHTEDVLVDTGPHEVVATAPGYEGRASAPVDREGAILDVIVRMEPVAEPTPTPAPAPAPRAKAVVVEPAPMRAATDERMLTKTTGHRRRNGIIIGAVGLGMLVGGGVTFAIGESKLDDYRTLCPDARCGNDADLAAANSSISDARTLRGVSLGMGIGGGVLLVAGTYLVLTGSSHVAVQADSTGASVAYTARF